MTADSSADDGGTGPELVVPTAIREAILERAREGQPAEICGILGGEYDPDGQSRVRSQYPAENVAETPRTRYRIDPEEQLEVFERLENDAAEQRSASNQDTEGSDDGEEIVGFYHSHPRGPPRPSATDAAQATWPDRSYLIVSLEPLEVGSWRWREKEASADDRFERERLVID